MAYAAHALEFTSARGRPSPRRCAWAPIHSVEPPPERSHAPVELVPHDAASLAAGRSAAATQSPLAGRWPGRGGRPRAGRRGGLAAGGRADGRLAAERGGDPG